LGASDPYHHHHHPPAPACLPSEPQNLAIRTTLLPHKFSPRGFTIGNQVFSRIVIKEKVLDNINMQKDLENESCLEEG
jgi:hypothetical protein